MKWPQIEVLGKLRLQTLISWSINTGGGNEFSCHSGHCIDIQFRCNNRFDCPYDDSDEQGCPSECIKFILSVFLLIFDMFFVFVFSSTQILLPKWNTLTMILSLATYWKLQHIQASQEFIFHLTFLWNWYEWFLPLPTIFFLGVSLRWPFIYSIYLSSEILTLFSQFWIEMVVKYA